MGVYGICVKTLVAAAACAALSAQALPVVTNGSALGKHGDIKVAVTFDDNKIQKIEVVQSNENKVLADKVFTSLRDDVVRTNSVQLDAISGATVSSKAFLQAVKVAADRAGVVLGKADKKLIKKVQKTLPKVNNYDVVVVGAGGAGFSAAIEAKLNGASVVILEKMPVVGGNSLISGAGMDVAGNWEQKKQNITDDTPARHAEDTLKGGDYKGDPVVVRTMTANALDAAKWVRDEVGVEFEKDYLVWFGGHSRKRALIPYGHNGVPFISAFQKKCDELGIPVITNMKAEALVQDEKGRVTGVKATMNDGEYTFNAKGGVVLATGGFGANPQMVKKYNPAIDERFKTTDAPGTTGEALYMAEKAGAQLVNMQYIQTYPTCDPVSGVIELIADTRFDGAILLNQEGKRFVEELERRDVISKAILKQTGGYCWVFWNQAIDDKTNNIAIHPTEYDTFTRQGTMFESDTLEGIAEKTGIPLKNLKSTISRVNKFAAQKKDEDFNHRMGLVDLSKGKYYAIKAVPSVHHTMGGVRIDKDARVINAKGQPIKGLYAAGEVTGVVHGTNRLGGNAYTDIIVFGRIAGRGAAIESF